MPTSDTTVATKRQGLHCEEVWISPGESESGRLKRIHINGHLGKEIQPPKRVSKSFPPITTPLLFLQGRGQATAQGATEQVDKWKPRL